MYILSRKLSNQGPLLLLLLILSIFFLYRKGREWNFLHPPMDAQRAARPDACWKREGIR